MRRICALFLAMSLLCIPVRGVQEEKYVALTFDDGPSGRFTRRLLERLEARNAKATFLLCGYRIREYRDTAQMVFQSGHEIGLHGCSHKCMGVMSRPEVTQEIRETLELIPQELQVSFLRPPGGKLNDAVRQAAKEADLSILNWSLDTRDWATDNEQEIVQRVLKNVKTGDVILMHDMSDSSVNAALTIIDELTRRGFCFVTASELAQKSGMTPQPGMVYNRFS